MKILRIGILGLLISLAGCSGLSPYRDVAPVDIALKTCGLGYSTEVGPVFKLAYEYAAAKGSVDFSGQMRENLDTQIASIAKNDAFSKGMDSKDKLALIQKTQDCVIKYTDALRPKTEGELVGACMADLQNRVAGNGKDWPVVKNWNLLRDHPKTSGNAPIVSAYVDTGGSASYWLKVQCKWHDGRYENLYVIGE